MLFPMGFGVKNDSMCPVAGRFSEAGLVSWTLEEAVMSLGFRRLPQGGIGRLSLPWVTVALYHVSPSPDGVT